MSLVRSLLSLAALLTIAIADGQGYCTTRIFGQTTDNPFPLPPVYVPSPGGEIDVPITACPSGIAQGELVEVCNTSGGSVPDVSKKYSDSLTPLEVVCTGCNVQITLYCP